MRWTERQLGWVLAFFVLWFTGCDSEAQRSGKVTGAAAQMDSLFGEIPPFEDLTTGACAHLRKHLEGRRMGDQIIRRVVDCEAPVLSPASQLGAAAAVATRLDVDGPPSHGAFLFVHFGKGWRPADRLLEPVWNHGGYCKTRFQLRWEGKGAKSEAILDAVSERICHMPLDQKEIAAGESDIATSECRYARYALAGDELTKLSEKEAEGPCEFR